MPNSKLRVLHPFVPVAVTKPHLRLQVRSVKNESTAFIGALTSRYIARQGIFRQFPRLRSCRFTGSSISCQQSVSFAIVPTGMPVRYSTQSRVRCLIKSATRKDARASRARARNINDWSETNTRGDENALSPYKNAVVLHLRGLPNLRTTRRGKGGVGFLPVSLAYEVGSQPRSKALHPQIVETPSIHMAGYLT